MNGDSGGGGVARGYDWRRAGAVAAATAAAVMIVATTGLTGLVAPATGVTVEPVAVGPASLQWSPASTFPPRATDLAPVGLGMTDNGSRVAIPTRIDGGDEPIAYLRAFVSSHAGSNWIESPDIAPPSDRAGSPVSAFSATGDRALLAWLAGDALHVATSTSGGDTWSAPTEVSKGTISMPAVAVSGGGSRAIAAWRSTVGADERIKAAVSGFGQTWSAPIDLTGPSSSIGQPDVVLADDGALVHLQWVSAGRLAYNRSDSSGKTWKGVRFLSTPSGPAVTQARLAASSNGVFVAAVWVVTGMESSWIEVATSSDQGVTWRQPQNLTFSGGRWAKDPSVIVSDDGQRITAVWTQGSSQAARVATSTSLDGGLTWSNSSLISPAGVSAREPVLAGSADGRRAVAVWVRTATDGTEVVDSAATADSGAGWSAPVDLSPSGKYGAPAVVASESGTRLAATWAWGFPGSEQWPPTTRVQAATGRLATLPEPPTAVAAQPGDASATIAWSAPGDDGGASISSYTATAAPGGASCTTTATACTITGLANGQAYTVSVTATNSVGRGPASQPSAPFAPVGAPSQPPPQPAPSPSEQGDPTPTPDPPRVCCAPPTIMPVVRVTRVAGRSKLRVRVSPDPGQGRQWRFRVQKRVAGTKWRSLPREYKTRTRRHVRTVDLPRGVYRVAVPAQSLTVTSRALRLRR